MNVIQNRIVRRGEPEAGWLYTDIPPLALDRPPPINVINNPGLKSLNIDPGQNCNKSQENCKSRQISNLT